MRIALAGRPGAGKSAVFDLLARKTEAEESGRGGLRVHHVDVPDPRVAALSAAWKPRKTTPARLEFRDLEQKAAPPWPALSPERRDLLAQSDLILLVVDLFNELPEDWDAAARRTWAQASDEAILLDLSVVETRWERLEKLLRIGQKPTFPGEPELLARVRESLEAGRPVRSLELKAEDERGLRGFSLLTARPFLVAFNLPEDGLGAPLPDLSEAGRAATVAFSAEVERQILELPADEQSGFLAAFGLEEPATARVVRAAYDLAGLMSFFTVGDDEVRAWSVRKGARAPEAAGAIHTDLEKGFVRAEVLTYADWVRLGSHAAARAEGALRLEGKEYSVSDGDIIEFRSGLARSRG